jgi:two-component sensor histidine kinase
VHGWARGFWPLGSAGLRRRGAHGRRWSERAGPVSVFRGGSSDKIKAKRADENAEDNWIGRADSEEFLLLREVNHRINNDFASIMAIVSRMAHRADRQEVKASLTEVADCIFRHAQVHQALQVPRGCQIDVNPYVAGLCRAISQSKLRTGVGLTFVETDGPLLLEADRCWRLGMVIAELITNAVRHAFDDGGGSISVELVEVGQFVECRVTDNGMFATDIRPGCGLKIVQALVESLDGKLVQQLRAGGSALKIIFPIFAG